MLVSVPLLCESLCVYVFVRVPFAILSLSLSLCEFLALSLSFGVCVCVCVCVWRKVPFSPESDFLHFGLSLASLPSRLCLGHVSACQPFSLRLHFGFVKASTS